MLRSRLALCCAELDDVESTTRINNPRFASDPTTEVHPTLIPGGRDQCAACGARMAPDQRYCVECGHRGGAPRFQFMDGLAQRQREAAAPPRRSRRFWLSPNATRLSPNATLIAGIGVLLLAMGIGVLIGRSGNSSGTAKTPAVQVVSVANGATGAAGATPTTTTTPAASSAKQAKSGSSTSSTSGGSTKTPLPPKSVTVGTPGKGPGYQKGKFTGNFFGQ
jgi:hypothetical protein